MVQWFALWPHRKKSLVQIPAGSFLCRVIMLPLIRFFSRNFDFLPQSKHKLLSIGWLVSLHMFLCDPPIAFEPVHGVLCLGLTVVGLAPVTPKEIRQVLETWMKSLGCYCWILFNALCICIYELNSSVCLSNHYVSRAGNYYHMFFCWIF